MASLPFGNRKLERVLEPKRGTVVGLLVPPAICTVVAAASPARATPSIHKTM